MAQIRHIAISSDDTDRLASFTKRYLVSGYLVQPRKGEKPFI